MDERETALKRFLDRLVSAPQRDPLQDQTNMASAIALGLVPDDNPAGARIMAPEELIEMTRAAIAGLAPQRAADQNLEAMSGPAATQPPPAP